MLNFNGVRKLNTIPCAYCLENRLAIDSIETRIICLGCGEVNCPIIPSSFYLDEASVSSSEPGAEAGDDKPSSENASMESSIQAFASILQGG